MPNWLVALVLALIGVLAVVYIEGAVGFVLAVIAFVVAIAIAIGALAPRP
jgi:hypothetical protein